MTMPHSPKAPLPCSVFYLRCSVRGPVLVFCIQLNPCTEDTIIDFFMDSLALMPVVSEHFTDSFFHMIQIKQEDGIVSITDSGDTNLDKK